MPKLADLMKKSRAGVDFFNGMSNFFGSMAGGWYPSPRGERVAPFWGVRSDAGKVVTAAGSLQIAAVWACVRLIAETVGSLPLYLYRGRDGEDSILATDSPLYTLISRSPNSYMTSVEFWEMMVAGLLLWGNAYAVKRRLGGRVVSLDPLRPEFVSVYRTDSGEIRYTFQRAEQIEDFSANDILHIKGFSVDGLVGISPIAVARQTIGRSLATDEAASRIYQSGMSASGFVSYSKSLTKDLREEIRGSIESFTGSSNIGKVMVLENGMTYTALSINPVDAQMLETRYFNVEEVCRWFGVQPPLIGHVSKASSWASSLENMILMFVKFGLRPVLTRIEKALGRSLIDPGDRATLFAAFDTEELQRGDSAARAALYASAAQNGWMKRREIRRRERLPSAAGDDQLTVQSNLVPLDRLSELGGQATPAPESKP